MNIKEVTASDVLQELLAERVLVIDGAMGTMVQALQLTEQEKKGPRFAEHPHDLSNLTDILCLTHPEKITEIHRTYLAAGADIVETNTFGASAVGLKEFGLDQQIVEENKQAAVCCARTAVEEFSAVTPDKPRVVAGSIGPTTKQMAISTSVEDAAYRAVTFDEMVDSYYQQVAVLVESGVDLLLPETVIDTLNLKSCLFAIEKYFDDSGQRVPGVVSGTFNDGVTFVSGQSIEAFWNAIAHFPLLAVGMNCAVGPEKMRPLIEELSQISTAFISCYHNALLY